MISHTFYPSVPDFSSLRFLVTGGGGFIGSHVLDLLVEAQAKKIKVLDNFSTGDKKNISHLLESGKVELQEGDISQYEDCKVACENVDIVIHLAALGSVPRSVANPLPTHTANSTGFLHVLWAAKEKGIKKVVYASSSSVYGDNLGSPKREGQEGNPLSPYAFTKQSNEAYAKLFGDLYGLQTIGLRFFNIFGARQNKDGPYAAFIPLAINAALKGDALTIYGDGSQSRDFTHVSNAVWAITRSVLSTSLSGAYNVACGASTSLVNVVKEVESISGKRIKMTFAPERQGDIKDSLADITLSKSILGFEPICDLYAGLKATIIP